MIKNLKNQKSLVRVLAFLIVCLIYFSIFNFPLSVNAASNDSDRVIVSLGDSFSSGEGIEPFYDQELNNYQKVKSLDWLAHRSEKSWPGMLTLDDENGNEILMSENRNVHWYFAASSGAETKHLKSEQYKKYNKSFGLDASTGKGVALPSQLSVLYDIKREYKKVDYVTLTLGGNDVGFTEVINQVALSSVYVKPTELYELIKGKIDMLNGKTGENLKQAYMDIYKAAGRETRIIVAGYPQLFCSVNANQQMLGQLFSIPERIIINNSVNFLNYKIQSIIEGVDDIEGLDESIPIHYVSVKEEFDGHEAYSLFSYINPVYLTPKPQDIDDRVIKEGPNPSSYSMHPNENGAKAYARCVQKKIDELEEEKSNEKPTSTDEYFYQLQQYNMGISSGVNSTLVYDENAIYYLSHNITEYGRWINTTDNLGNIEVWSDWYRIISPIPFSDKTNNQTKSGVSINITSVDSSTVLAIGEDYIYYQRDDALYRNPIYFTDKTESNNYFLYYNEEYNEESISYTDEKICDFGEFSGNDWDFILSEKYIYTEIYTGEETGYEIIRMYHDGSKQTTVMSGIGQSTCFFGWYTIENDLYFVCDGVLYCNYEDSAECTAICEVGTDVSLIEALDDTLYFRHVESQGAGSYKQTIYKYEQGDEKIVKYAETITNGLGEVFVDPNGVVLFVCDGESINSTYLLEKDILSDGFDLHKAYSYIFVYKNSIYGVSTDGKNLVPIHEF